MFSLFLEKTMRVEILGKRIAVKSRRNKGKLIFDSVNDMNKREILSGLQDGLTEGGLHGKTKGIVGFWKIENNIGKNPLLN